MLLFLLSLVYIFGQFRDLILLPIAQQLANFESTTLRIPESLRFFTDHESDSQLCFKAAVLLALTLHSFVTFPVMDYVMGEERTPLGMGRLATWTSLSLGVWAAFVIVGI
jgi:hypothetical protein